MSPETVVIACPACRHLVRVPADWLGQTVQCPECQAKFTAPTREGEQLGEAKLLDTPQSDSNASSARRGPDRALWVSAFLLMLLGVVSLAANSMTLASILSDPVAFEASKKEEAEKLSKMMGQEPEQVAVSWQTYAGFTIWGIICGVAAFGGGLGITLRRWYWLARLGSALAIVNVAGCCCVPGAFVGVWTWLLLRSSEGREHFQ